MEGETEVIGGYEAGFTKEDSAELIEIINLVAATNIEEISEFYKSGSGGVNCNAENAWDSGSVVKKMLNNAECASLLAERFSTREELLDRVRNMALKEGYVTTIKKSKPGRYVIIGCDRGGKYRGASVPLNERKKMSGSRLVNCPFQMRGKNIVGDPWKVEIKNVSHNHEPSSDMSGHPFCRRFSKEEVLSIKQMTMAGIPPRQILTSLRQNNSNCKAIARTLYNTKAVIKKEPGFCLDWIYEFYFDRKDYHIEPGLHQFALINHAT